MNTVDVILNRVRASSWPSDFFTLLCSVKPRNFKESNKPCTRGIYDGDYGAKSLHFTVTKSIKPSGDRLLDVYNFTPSGEQPENLNSAIQEFISDLDFAAYRNSYVSVRTPAAVAKEPACYMLGRTAQGLKLLVNPA